MELLVIGGGGREHAIIRKIKESPLCGTVYCAPGNGGISADAICCPETRWRRAWWTRWKKRASPPSARRRTPP